MLSDDGASDAGGVSLDDESGNASALSKVAPRSFSQWKLNKDNISRRIRQQRCHKLWTSSTVNQDDPAVLSTEALYDPGADVSFVD
jgi:hypothetical protein